MADVELESQAVIVRAILPAADIRTDQCDTLRVYYNGLFGATRPLTEGGIQWSVIDLNAPGDISCVVAEPFVTDIASSPAEAAHNLANAMLQGVSA